ncbi:hypothetical protein J6590_018912 [Homalodisca vitripennis]|nr:hypothetical protein J6590_018912 [Homalodisca vitripennis]
MATCSLSFESTRPTTKGQSDLSHSSRHPMSIRSCSTFSGFLEDQLLSGVGTEVQQLGDDGCMSPSRVAELQTISANYCRWALADYHVGSRFNISTTGDLRCQLFVNHHLQKDYTKLALRTTWKLFTDVR